MTKIDIILISLHLNNPWGLGIDSVTLPRIKLVAVENIHDG